ncbi:hypothetical protein HPC49_29740 [Pyxidicoccus fallax]|uniref:Tetratricopeptide repeat protein n=1 Tax=Pyxidicoccus fallax TaxID=394095 RepID=A0A848LLL3_9BACT|nr:hypothetical protein [Pyxidicoccus fallax]NMO18601.1 hypothetical protein [Pyxidicoccus fallax]NPC82391.1 hypothetical protein [Pyxidicoccus fallax]
MRSSKLVPTPRMGLLLAGVLLLSLPGRAPAQAVSRLSCPECDRLPPDYTMDVARCQPLTPLLSGEPAAVAPRDTDTGRFFDFDLAGDGSHPVRVWAGQSFGTPYFAVFDGSKSASVCSTLGAFADVAMWESRLEMREGHAGLPYLTLFSDSRLGHCAFLGATAEIAYLQLQKTWVILQPRSRSSPGACVEEGTPGEEALQWERHSKLHAEGLRAYKRKDFVTAERLWRQVEAEGGGMASHDLGLLLARQGQLAQAEPRLLLTAGDSGLPSHWLDLADFYWVAKHRGLAAKAYRQYLQQLANPHARKRGTKAPTPVQRALERAEPKRPSKPPGLRQ